jgi:ABC-type phosphate transport system ATPase subunit
MVFLAFKTLLSPHGTGKKTFFSILNVMILQTVRNECVRFGGHVDIEVSYKILQLDVLKETPILHNLSCFE